MQKSKADEEEYWNSSKFRAFTFDDEDDEFTRLKESKRAVNSIRSLVEEEEEDEEEVEKVSWSGEPVGSISWSVKETASSLRAAGGAREPGFPKINTTPALPRSNSGYSISSLFKGKPKAGSFQSMSDGFSDASGRSFAPELRKPKCEYKDYSGDWSPEETVKRMQQGKEVSLERFRALQDKLLLLDQAVGGHDGNVITAVLIYLKKSLCQDVLFRKLVSRETALRHYVHFLKEAGQRRVLLELYRTLGKMEEAALLQYKEHLKMKDENSKRDFLKTCLNLPFPPDDSVHIQDHFTLLERQIIIVANDRQLESGGQVEVISKCPRKASILHMPLITTLYYCCVYHYAEPEGTYSSPSNIRKTFRLSERQYFLTALDARSKLKSWSDLDQLMTSKNWLGQTRRKSPVAFSRVVDILHKNNAPSQVLQLYLPLVEDSELKLSLAQKLKCHDVVIDIYKDLKDRQQLLGYQRKMERGSAEEKKIEELISSSQIRWKN